MLVCCAREWRLLIACGVYMWMNSDFVVGIFGVAYGFCRLGEALRGKWILRKYVEYENMVCKNALLE